MNSRRIFVVGSATGYASWLVGHLVPTMEEADLVMFTGGEDINPELYGDVAHISTYFSNRDFKEVAAFKKAVALKKPIIGICRGAQLGCALSGGKLIQDQYNPGTHKMYTHDKREFKINSLHHQAMFPFNMPETKYKLIGWAVGHSGYHHNGKGEEMNPPKECEVVYFKETNCLGIQCHPEMLYYYQDRDPEIARSIAYFRELVDVYIPAKTLAQKFEEKALA